MMMMMMVMMMVVKIFLSNFTVGGVVEFLGNEAQLYSAAANSEFAYFE
jgi:hypothetical protein